MINSHYDYFGVRLFYIDENNQERLLTDREVSTIYHSDLIINPYNPYIGSKIQGVIPIIKSERLPQELTTFLMTKYADFNEILRLPISSHISTQFYDGWVDQDSSFIEDEPLRTNQYRTKTYEFVLENSLMTTYGSYGESDETTPISRSTNYFAYRYIVGNYSILAINTKFATKAVICGADWIEDTDEPELSHWQLEESIVIDNLNSATDCWNLCIVIDSLNHSDTTNYSPKIHNISWNPHFDFDRDTNTENNYAKNAFSKILRDDNNVDRRTGIKYTKSDDVYTEIQLSPIQSTITEYESINSTLANELVAEYLVNRSYGMVDAVGNIYCIWLNKLFKVGKGSDKPPLTVVTDDKVINHPDSTFLNDLINSIYVTESQFSNGIDTSTAIDNCLDNWSMTTTLPSNSEYKLVNNYTYLQTDYKYLMNYNLIQEYQYYNEYKLGDVVRYNNRLYRSLINKNIRNKPNLSKYWRSIQ